MSSDEDCEGQRFCNLLTTGTQLYLKGEDEKAVENFTAALALNPDEKNRLVCRSRCYMRMGQFEKALRDAEASLKDDKTFCEGLYQKAEALFYMGELEYALMYYHRGHKLRPQMKDFKLGILKAQKDIINCINRKTRSLSSTAV
ncbi:outer dynein arm-docking complex subunit 4-like isoform X2 [Paralichthys olivaceus]|uniref:outer dynein arm-docking complex subunit 4-like isoform X2 n=1 Tax=Paralichthys olivaceus TaxID=8255 RepID=UPI003751D852